MKERAMKLWTLFRLRLRKGSRLRLLFSLGATLMILLKPCCASAQTFSEWFRQDKTQIKYLYQQIAALEAYSGVTEDGNDIEDAGLGEIDEIAAADLTMHADHFASFAIVKPAIGSGGMADVVRRLADVGKGLALALRGLAGELRNTAVAMSGNAVGLAGNTDDLLAYADWMIKYADGLDVAMDGYSVEVDRLTTDGIYVMQDAERWEALQRVYSSMSGAAERAFGVYRACLIIKSGL